MRLTGIVLLAVVATGCSLLPPRRPLGTPVPTARPTATPGPLLAASGQGPTLLPHLVVPGMWNAQWSYACVGTSWTILIAAHPTRRTQRPRTTLILSRTSASAARRGHGTTVMTDRGNLFVSVTASPSCRWRLVARSGIP